MTPTEFKAWFDGFTEALEGTPTVKQWARIKERVAEIDGKKTTEYVYLNNYLPRWQRQYYGPYDSAVYLSAHSTAGADPAALTAAARPNLADIGVGRAAAVWNSTDAMYALGKADAEAAE